MEKFLDTKDLKGLLEILGEKFDIAAPVEENDVVLYRFIKDFSPEKISSRLPRMSPKKFFFPNSEELFSYEYRGKDVEVRPPGSPEKPCIIFGLAPCDLKSFEIMDRLFRWETVDQPYFARRDNTYLISRTCETPLSTCFCTSTECAPHFCDGADLHFTEIDGGVLVEILTGKGEELAGAAGNLLKDADSAAKEQAEAVKKEKEARVPLKLDKEEIKKRLDAFFIDEFWDSVSEKCIKCGICTYLCPTCHCFNICDESDFHGGTRIRCWDSCMYSEYTKMAGGHNPRAEEKRRFRNRMYHKFYYYKENLGATLCVGCGRCIQHCPVGMDIIEICGAICGAGGTPAIL